MKWKIFSEVFSFLNNLAPFRVGETNYFLIHFSNILSTYRFSFFCPSLLLHSSQRLGEMKNFGINKMLSFLNNLAPFRVGEANYFLIHFSNILSTYRFSFFPLPKVFHLLRCRFSFFPLPKGWNGKLCIQRGVLVSK